MSTKDIRMKLGIMTKLDFDRKSIDDMSKLIEKVAKEAASLQVFEKVKESMAAAKQEAKEIAEATKEFTKEIEIGTNTFIAGVSAFAKTSKKGIKDVMESTVSLNKETEKVVNNMATFAGDAKILLERTKGTVKSTKALGDAAKRVTANLSKAARDALPLKDRIKLAAKEAFNLSTMIDRSAFVITAKFTYQMFDGFNRALREGRQNAIMLEAQLARIESISKGKSIAPVERSIKRAIGLGFEPSDAMESAYQSISAQFSPADAEKLLAAANKAAVAGFVTEGEALKALIAILNTYQLGVGDVTRVSDVLFKVIEQGLINFDQLSKFMGNVLPTAKLLGIEFEEVAAAMSTMTLKGIKADVAITSLNQLFMNLAKPTPQAKRIYDEHNLSLDLAEVKAQGLAKTVQKIADANLKAEELATIAGSRTGFRALASAMASNVEWAENYERMLNVAGETQAAFNKQMDTADMKIKQFKGSVTLLIMSLNKFAVETAGLLTIVRAVVDGFNGWFGATTLAIGILGALIKVIIKVNLALKSTDAAIKLLTSTNLWLAGIAATLGLVSMAIGMHKKKVQEAQDAEKEWVERAVGQSLAKENALKKELELLVTYKKYTEELAKGKQLDRLETSLLATVQDKLTTSYGYTKEALKDYNGLIDKSTASLRKNQEETIKLKKLQMQSSITPEMRERIAHLYPFFEVRRKGEISPEDNVRKALTDAKKYGYGTMIPREKEEMESLYASLANATGMYDNIIKAYRADIEKIESSKHMTASYKDIQEITNNTDSEFKNYLSTIGVNLSNSNYSKYFTEYRNKYNELYNNNYLKKQNELKSKEIKKVQDSIDAFSKHTSQQVSDAYEWMGWIKELQMLDEASSDLKIEPLRPESSVIAQTEKKETFIKHESAWRAAKIQYEQEISSLDNLTAAKQAYFESIKTFYTTEPERIENLKETANRDFLDVINRRFTETVRNLELQIQTAKSKDEIIKLYGKIETEYNNHIKTMGNIEEIEDKAKKRVLANLKVEKDSALRKTDVEVVLARNQYNKALADKLAKEELKLFEENESNLFNQYKEIQQGTIKEMEAFQELNSEILSNYNGAAVQLKDTIKERRRIQQLMEESVSIELAEKKTTTSGALAAFGVGTKNKTLQELEAVKKFASKDEYNTPDVIKKQQELEAQVQYEMGQDIAFNTKSLLDNMGDLYEAYLQRRLAQIEKEKEASLAAIDEQAKMQYRSSWWVQAEKERVEEQAEKERRKYLKRQKMSSISEAIMNTALGVTNVWSKWAAVLPVALALTGLVTATGAAQLVTINAQKFGTGGLVKHGLIEGRTHAQGGELIEVEDGEYVFSAKAVKGNERFLDALHSDLQQPSLSALTAPNTAASASAFTPQVTVYNDNRELKGMLGEVVNSIKDIKVEIAMHGEFISDIKLAKRVDSGNRQRRTV